MLHHSTTQALMFRLVLVVSSVVIVVGIINYYLSTTQLQRTLEVRAEKVVAHISDQLSLALWNLDASQVLTVSNQQRDAEGLSTIVVTDDFGEVLTRLGEEQPGETYITQESAVEHQGQRVGTVAITLDTKEIAAASGALIQALFVLVLLMIVTICLTTFFVMRKLVSQPIAALVQGFESISKKDFSYHTPSFVQADMNFISTSFNKMSADLQISQQELVELNKNLEVKVAKRTKELKTKNVELERLNHTMVNRELKMIELKKIISDLQRV